MSLYSLVNGYKFGNPDKNMSYENNMTEEQLRICNMIGILTADIRGHWTDISARLNGIRELCQELGKQEWLDQLEDNIEEIYYDGRWFRDVWNGPYENMYCTSEVVGQKLYDKYIDILHYLKEDID